MKLEQTIAAKALELVKAQSSGEPSEPEYRSFVEGFPILLRQAGLLQAMLFCKAKGGHPHGVFFDHLRIQLCGVQLLGQQDDLADKLSKLPAVDYRLFSQMADRIAYWHKRMAQAYLRTRKELEKK